MTILKQTSEDSLLITGYETLSLPIHLLYCFFNIQYYYRKSYIPPAVKSIMLEIGYYRVCSFFRVDTTH